MQPVVRGGFRVDAAVQTDEWFWGGRAESVGFSRSVGMALDVGRVGEFGRQVEGGPVSRVVEESRIRERSVGGLEVVMQLRGEIDSLKKQIKSYKVSSSQMIQVMCDQKRELTTRTEELLSSQVEKRVLELELEGEKKSQGELLDKVFELENMVDQFKNQLMDRDRDLKQKIRFEEEVHAYLEGLLKSKSVKNQVKVIEDLKELKIECDALKKQNKKLAESLDQKTKDWMGELTRREVAEERLCQAKSNERARTQIKENVNAN